MQGLYPALGQRHWTRSVLEANIQESQPHRAMHRKAQAVQARRHTLRPQPLELPCNGQACCRATLAQEPKLYSRGNLPCAAPGRQFGCNRRCRGSTRCRKESGGYSTLFAGWWPVSEQNDRSYPVLWVHPGNVGLQGNGHQARPRHGAEVAVELAVRLRTPYELGTSGVAV